MLRTVVRALIVSLVISVFILKFLPIPYCWIGLIWGAIGLAIATRSTRFMQVPFVIAASVSLAVSVGEAFLAMTSSPEILRETIPTSDEPDPLLGWKAKPGQVVHATEKIGSQFIYDVWYSIDQAGHRISPPDRGEKVEGCLFFFVDSFSFGEGVGDDETFPYQVGYKTNGRFRVVNFSFNGYGAEHMLVTMERGDLPTHPPCEPTHIFYTALPHHVLRAAGKTTFSMYGPQYRLGPDGNPEYLGTKPRPTETRRSLKKRVVDQLSKSQIYRVLFEDEERTTEGDVERYFAIVNEVFNRFERRWPRARLHVISWDLHDFYSNGKDRFNSGLRRIKAKIHFIDDILPGYTKDPTKYGLHRFDLHPNPTAHEMIASYLTKRVLYPTRVENG